MKKLLLTFILAFVTVANMSAVVFHIDEFATRKEGVKPEKKSVDYKVTIKYTKVDTGYGDEPAISIRISDKNDELKFYEAYCKSLQSTVKRCRNHINTRSRTYDAITLTTQLKNGKKDVMIIAYNVEDRMVYFTAGIAGANSTRMWMGYLFSNEISELKHIVSQAIDARAVVPLDCDD